MIHKTTKTILRTLALALTICATCRAWAVTIPSVAGTGYLPATDTTVFRNVLISDIGTSYALRARAYGTNVDYKGTETIACNRYAYSSGTAIRYEMQFHDGSYIKCVIVKLTQSGDDVQAKVLTTRYVNKSSFTIGYAFHKTDANIDNEGDGTANDPNYNGSSYGANGLIATSDDTGGYGLKELRLVDFKKSINVNFSYGTGGLSSSFAGPIGAGDYPVPVSAWDNVLSPGETFSTPSITKMLKTDGTTESLTGVTCSLTGTRGSYSCSNLLSSFDLRYGYVDDNANNKSPTVTFAGISTSEFPYYRVVVYHANEAANVNFGYDTIAGSDYIGMNGKTVLGKGTWGDSGVKNYADKLAEGINFLVSPVIQNTDGNLVVKSTYTDSERTGIAAISIVAVDAPASYTFTPTAGVTSNISGTSSLWADSVSENNEANEGANVTISISGECTVNLNANKAFNNVTITGSGTLILTGDGMISATAVTVGSGITVKASAGRLNTPSIVLNDATAILDINDACTWAGVISGAGKVKVSGNVVTFSAANTYTGGLTVASGGLAKSSNAAGFGSTSTTIVVAAGGTLDISGSNGYGYSYNIAGTGIDGNGAVINTGAANPYYLYSGVTDLTLSADATVNCSNSWGVHAGRTISLQDHNLTLVGGEGSEWYIQGCHMNPGSSNTGKLIVSNGVTVKTANGNGTGFNVDVQTGATLNIQSNFPVRDLSCSGTITQSAGTITCSGAMGVSGTFNQTGGTLTCNSTLSVTGTMTAGATVNCNDNLTVGGTIDVNGTFTVASGKTITKSGTGVINIGSSGVVIWTDTAWTEGDIFRGSGILNLSGNITHTISNSGFEGVLKITHTGSMAFASYPAFTGRPELMCDCSGDNKGFFLGGGYAGKSFNVRNLNGGLSYIACKYESPTDTKVVDTLQTRDTVFTGKFISESESDASQRKTGLTVRGEAATGVHSLTLTKASPTCGELTIDAYGKLIFDSEASWANGTVIVNSGGYLEPRNANSIAKTLNLNDGATVVLPLDSGDNEVVLTASTVNLADSGTVYVDLSAWSFTENEEKTIVTATSALSASAAATVIKPASGNFSFRADGTAIKATRLGACTWTDGSWSYDPAYSKESAVINVAASGSTLNLGANSYTFDTLTLSGTEGTLSITGTGKITAQNLVVPTGVTLDVSSGIEFSSATGTGTINVPAGVTYTMSDVTCSVKVTVQNTGHLKTSGATNLSSNKNAFEVGSQFTVENGSTNSLNAASQGLKGTITIDSGATLVNTRDSDAINYGGTTVLNVYGTLDMGSTRWSLSNGNTINVYEGALIKGNGQPVNSTNAGALDWIENKNCSMNVYGNAEISARLRVRSGATVAVDISSGKTLTVSGSYQNYDTSDGTISVSGGTIKLGATDPFVNGAKSCKLRINNGAAIDINGNKPTNQIYLVGDGPDGNGALINTGADMGSNIAMKITLTGNASWGGAYYTHFGAATDIYLDGYTFTKKGSNYFPLNNTVMRGTGKIVVEEGQFQNNNNNNRLDGIDLEVQSGATLNMTGGNSLRIHDFTCAGTISGTGAKLVVNGTYNVNGAQSIPKLEMVTNSAIAFATTSSKLTATTLTFALPENGKVLLDVAGLNIPSEGMELINCNSTDNFSAPAGYYLDVVDGSVYAYQTVVNITVPVIANTTVTVTVGGVDQVGVDGDGVKTYSVPYGSAVVVTYTAVSGYELSGTPTYNIASATTDETITITDTVANPYVARVRNFTTNQNDQYTSLASAVAAADGVTHASSITLLANVTEAEVTVSSAIWIMGNYTINADIKIVDGGQLQLMQATLGGKLTIEENGIYTTGGGTLSELVAKDGATIELTTLNATTAPLSVTTLSVEGTLTVKSSYSSGAFGSTYKAISYVTANATIAQNAEFVGVNQWESSVATDGDNTIVSLTFTKIAVVNGLYYENAQDAVDAAVEGNYMVSFLVGDPGTVKLGAGETLVVSGANIPIVALDDGLTNPPYEVVHTVNALQLINTYTVERYVAKLRNPIIGTSTYADEVKYTSLAAAVGDVEEQSDAQYADYVATVTLLDDEALAATVVVGKKTKLDLNGKTLTVDGITAITNSTDLTIQGSSGSIVATSGNSVVLTDAAATLTVSSGVTLSANSVTTDVEGKVVKWVVDGNTTSYTVVDPVAQIGDTQYGSLANALENASDTATITILANMDSVEVGVGQKVVVASGVSVGTISWGAEYATRTNVTGDGTTEFAASATATTFYSVVGENLAWATPNNWKVGAAGGPTASRAPAAGDTVYIVDCSSVTIASASAIDGLSSLRGTGTLVLPTGTLPSSSGLTLLLKNDNWDGTVWIKGIDNIVGVTTGGKTLFEPNEYGNAGSTIKLSGVKGWILGAKSSGATINPTIELDDDTYGYGLWLTDGYGYNSGNEYYTNVKGLKGTGTLIGSDKGDNVLLKVEDWNDFSGTLTLTNKVVVFGTTLPTQTHIDYGGYVIVNSEKSVEVPEGKTWTVGQGAIIDGNLTLGDGASIVNTTAANTWIKRGTGTVTLNALADLPATPANAWEGTVVLPSIDSINDDFDFNTYGNEGSTVKVTTIGGGYLKNVAIDTAVEIGTSLQLTNFSAGRNNTFKKLTGSGLFSVSCAETSVDVSNQYGQGWYSNYSAYFLVNDISDFEGSITVSNAGVAIGDSKPQYQTPGGKIIVNSGKTATVGAGKAWTTSSGIVVDGTLTVSNTSTLTGTITGSGTLAYATGAVPTNSTTAPTFDSSSWTGTVEFPVFAASGIKLGEYGTGNSKIKLNGITSGHLMWEDQNIQSEVVLAGDVNITATSHRSYAYAHMSGTGSFSVANNDTSAYDPTALTIAKLDVASGSVGMAVTNNTGTTLTITVLALPEGASVVAGTKLLTIGGSGNISVGGVTVNGAAVTVTTKTIANDGIYVAAASYGGTPYLTIAEAVAAAGDDLDGITVHDHTASIPEGVDYYIKEVSGVWKVVKYFGSVTKTLFGTTSTILCQDIDALTMAINTALAEQAFGGVLHYVTILTGDAVSLPKYADNMVIKNEGGAAITITGYSDEYTPHSDTVDGTTTYTFDNIAREYIWKGGATKYVMDGNMGTYQPDPAWSTADNWRYVDSNSVTNDATRSPMTAANGQSDTVVFPINATAELSANVTVASVTLGSGVALTLNAASETTPTLTTTSAIHLSRGQTITLGTGVTLTPTPTPVDPKTKVIFVGDTYKVVYGTIFSVY